MAIYVNGRSDSEVVATDSHVAERGEATAHGIRAPVETLPRPGFEDYDTLLWRLYARREMVGGASFLVGFSGCCSQSGVSSLAANLAIRAVDHSWGPVLLADANFQKPSLGGLLRAGDGLGLANVLAGQATVDACLRSTQTVELDFLPIGRLEHVPRVSIDPQQVDALVAQLRERYALVIFDLPEARALGNAAPLAGALDAVLLVVRAERARRESAKKAIRGLAADGVPLIGAVLTDQRRYLPRWLDRLL
jgi:Mrp family chromosome partitioning ATPase